MSKPTCTRKSYSQARKRHSSSLGAAEKVAPSISGRVETMHTDDRLVWNDVTTSFAVRFSYI